MQAQTHVRCIALGPWTVNPLGSEPTYTGCFDLKVTPDNFAAETILLPNRLIHTCIACQTLINLGRHDFLQAYAYSIYLRHKCSNN